MRWLSSLLAALSEAVQYTLLRLWAVRSTRSPAQGLVEYGLILVLIMVVCVAILTITGRTVSTVWYEKIINNPAFQ